jgi:two-component system, chemotaxis family, chemotaxis protein CheY
MTKILIIDDSPIVFKMIKKVLELKGFEIVGHAENGRIGLEMIERLKPDIITLDVTMPIMDGLEMAKELYGKDPGAKVIMLSSMGDEDLIESAKKIGIKHFSTKPVKGDELIQIIKSMET